MEHTFGIQTKISLAPIPKRAQNSAQANEETVRGNDKLPVDFVLTIVTIDKSGAA